MSGSRHSSGSIGTPEYRVRHTERPPAFSGDWDGGLWASAATARIDHFHPKSSPHRPRTEVKVLYDSSHLYLFFRVADRYVRCLTTRYQGPVSADSCVEFFVQPRPTGGYFNFEMNCGGTLLLYYIEDPRRVGNGFARYRPVDRAGLKGMRVYHSLPPVVEPEATDPVVWKLEYSIPLSLFEPYLGESPRPDAAGRPWRGNFYKCAEVNSHPHWAAWSPIGERLDFHCPEHFGLLHFDSPSER